MKLSGRRAAAALARPDPALRGFLLFGEDGAEIAAARRRLVAALGGEAEDMAVERLDAAALRRDPALLSDALRAIGFFGGRRIVVLEGATDGLDETIGAALDGVEARDAALVASAGALKGRSPLRRRFEADPTLAAIAFSGGAMDRAEIEETLRELGAPAPSPQALRDLEALAGACEKSEMRAILRSLALYKGADAAPVAPAEVAAVAPAMMDGDVDDVIAAVAERDPPGLARALSRLFAQGGAPTTAALQVSRHFRQLHAVASARGGPEAALRALRPPVWGPRRDALLAQASRWKPARIERALATLTEAELALRSTQAAPDRALLERALMRVAMMR